MSQSCGLHLIDVVCHVPGRDTSRMYASHGEPMEASKESRSEMFCNRNCSVNGRSASGFRIILSLSSMSEVFGIKIVLLSAKCSGTVPSFQQKLTGVEQGLGAPSPRTLIGAIRNSIGVRCRIFLQSNDFIKFGSIESPTDAVRSFLHIPQDIFMLVMPRTFVACLKNCTPDYT